MPCLPPRFMAYIEGLVGILAPDKPLLIATQFIIYGSAQKLLEALAPTRPLPAPRWLPEQAPTLPTTRATRRPQRRASLCSST